MGTIPLIDFYQTFSAACFALLGLWLVVVQIRLDDWRADPIAKRRAYGVALHFVLPGMMGVFALVDESSPVFWRVSFAVVAFGGAVVMFAVRGFPVPVADGRRRMRTLPGIDQVGLAAFAAAIVLYVLVGWLAIEGGTVALRTAAVLLTVLVFLGFNVAWLLLFEYRSPGPRASDPTQGQSKAVTAA
jgi:peptidoglycan/LPS O-acetylase OafA/YrhL